MTVHPPFKRAIALALLAPFAPYGAMPAWAQPLPALGEGAALQPVFITGTSPENKRFSTAASLDIIDAEEIQGGQLQINLSESLGRVPGLVAANRNNYAQDMQIAIRGFGARATFGVRGIRLYVDGIPASAPDGQGQVAHFPLSSAQRIEVLRGPYSALYGASSGGVIALYTEDGARPNTLRFGAALGAYGTTRFSVGASGITDSGLGYTLDTSQFETDGFRPQSAAERSSANVKLTLPVVGGAGEGRWTLVANRLRAPDSLDPLGLSRVEFNANPYQTTPAALQFNTRKSVQQDQLGLAHEKRLDAQQRIELLAYAGQRQVQQFQSIPASNQLAASSAGGVIDLERNYWGLNARWRLEQTHDAGKLSLAAGVSTDSLTEQRRGFQNFSGAASSPNALGTVGALRRQETNRASNLDPYAQLDWQAQDWGAFAGLRHSRVRFKSRDQFIAPGNPDDSGSTSYASLLPVLGVWHLLTPQVQAYASLGRGFETPTFNEAAYRPSGATGLNFALQASQNRSLELGLKGRHKGLDHGQVNWALAVFETSTEDEIAVLSNTGGRSTFQNVGRTLRRGLEASVDWRWQGFSLTSSATRLDATYRDEFRTCAAAPCSAPTLAVPAGSRLPGIPKTALYAQLGYDWFDPQVQLALEARRTGKIFVNDNNSDSAAAYTVLSLVAKFKQDLDATWQLREFVRVDNLGQRRYAGSVIVNEGNGRFFEPGAPRAWLVGIEVVKRFE